MRNLDRLLSQLYNMAGDVNSGARYLRSQPETWQPATDIFETEDAVLIVMELPGVSKEAISVTAEQGALRVSGTRTKNVPPGTVHVHLMEVAYGPFARSIRMPPDSDLDNASAKHDEGYLTIRVPRKGAV